MRPVVLAATCFGLGRWPWGPGTFTSAAVALGAHLLGGPGSLGLLAAALAITAAGVPLAGAAEAELGADAPEITVDEVAGMLVALSAAPRSGAGVLAAFLLFRAFDILKPPPLSALHRLRGGLGVMADDVAAGACAGALLLLLRLPGSRIAWLSATS